MTIADTTLNQLGGGLRLSVMIGARNFMSDDDGRTLCFKFKSCRKASYVRITLNGLDLYDIEFIKPARFKATRGRHNQLGLAYAENKTTGEFENVAADQMRDVFESFTGLVLSL